MTDNATGIFKERRYFQSVHFATLIVSMINGRDLCNDCGASMRHELQGRRNFLWKNVPIFF